MSLSSPLAPAVVTWARRSLRDLPWRASRDPWGILVAETMLQQTQVVRVADRWGEFLSRFPDPAVCATAGPASVLREWAGLGYNRRALMLHGAAERISSEHCGVVPCALDELLALPGVGPYTARAVLAFAFEKPAAPVDTNVGRVLARQFGRTLARREAQELADSLVPAGHAWIYNQGIMELGATICTKRMPACDRCPVADGCAWRGDGDDPAVGSAGTSGGQGRFAGSDRELRGRVVDALRFAPMAIAQVRDTAGFADDTRRDRVIGGLVADGLVEIDGGVIRLRGDGATPVR